MNSKGLEKSIGYVGAKKRTLFNVFNKILALQMKVCNSRMSK